MAEISDMEPAVFRYQAIYGWVYVGLGIVFIAMGSLAISVLFEGRNLPLLVSGNLLAIGGTAVLAGLAFIRHSEGHRPYTVQVKDEGLEIARRRRVTLLRWDEIVGLRDRPLTQRIDLKLSGRADPVPLHYQTASTSSSPCS